MKKKKISIECDEGLFSVLREMKGEYTWAELLRLLVMSYYASKGEFLALPPRSVYESWSNISKRLPLKVTKIARVHHSLTRECYRDWVKKYANYEVYSALGVRGYDTITLWLAKSSDALILINIKTNFLNPPPKEEYIDLLIKTLRETLRRFCIEKGVCTRICLDPEMPLDQEVAERINQEFKAQQGNALSGGV
jgi:hypothetical protein